ncbi:MAG: hypothetical protein CAK90_03935, partial [Spartobacteria bacterium AMD-G4]
GGVGFVHTTTVHQPSRAKRLFSIAGFGLKSLGAEAQFQIDWPELSNLLTIRPLDVQIVGRGVEIRRACSDRLPTVDSLIAATASFHNMVLVHRDPHFESIPRKLLRQVSLCPPTAS